MCGVFGIITNKETLIGPLLLHAGQRLSHRGYDSVGCATFKDNGTIDLRKDVGKIEELTRRFSFDQMTGSRGIIQLRWATFGSPSQVNAQPHLDSEGSLAGAHNGNIVNNVELRQQFLQEGMMIRSTNDGETCVHAVERYTKQGYDLVAATRFAYGDLAGDYSFVIGRAGEDNLCAIKRGSVLVVGLMEGATCVSSDLPSILSLTKQVIRINDGEIVVLWADHIEIYRISDGSLIHRAAETISDNIEPVDKDGYAHYMLKEIYEQPRAAGELIRMLEDSPTVLPFVEKTAGARHLFLVGCGTSYHACLLGAVYSSWLSGRTAIPIMAPQFVAQYAPALSSGDVVVLVSQSGETKDILTAEEVARQKGASTLAIVNVAGSTLARVTEHFLPLVCGHEISVPATKTFTNQALTFLYLTLKMRNIPTASLDRLPGLLQQTLEMVEPQIKSLQPELNDQEDYYCLGYGATFPVALEGALKLKEITYAHCEGLLSTEFKHGPLSAVQPGYPVLFIAGPDDVPIMVSGMNEVICRGGNAIVIGEPDRNLANNATKMISLPQTGPLLNPLLATLPLQLLAYNLSIARGHDPDFPRNLSKTLTVD